MFNCCLACIHCSLGTQRLWNQMPWVTNLRTNLSKACLVLTPEGIVCTRNDCCSMVCSHTMAVCCTLITNMFLFVLYFNFSPHLEILGESQFTLRSFRGVPVRMFDIFYLPKKLVIFRGVPVKKTTLYLFFGGRSAFLTGKPSSHIEFGINKYFLG